MSFATGLRFITQQHTRDQEDRGGRIVDWKLELVVVPVSDVDRAKTFYTENVGFKLDVDHRAGEDFRVVQLTPSGSACSITIMRNTEAAGSLQGLHLVVSDIEAARAELVDRRTDVSEIYHFDSGGQVPGPDPQRSDYGSFLSFSDPDGNGWLVQEVKRAEPEP
jgi:predicted enzyme related to lactoylglutathione lyase